MKSNVNDGLWVVMPCQCKFITCNKWTTLVGMLIVGEAVLFVGSGVYGNSLYSLLSFAVNLQLL